MMQYNLKGQQTNTIFSRWFADPH